MGQRRVKALPLLCQSFIHPILQASGQQFPKIRHLTRQLRHAALLLLGLRFQQRQASADALIDLRAGGPAAFGPLLDSLGLAHRDRHLAFGGRPDLLVPADPDQRHAGIANVVPICSAYI
jgi:hypothetical protein